MSAKKVSSDRRRSRPVTKSSAKTKIKRNKPAMFLSIFICLILVLSGVYVIFSGFGNNTDSDISYQDDPEYIEALAGTIYPVAVLETSKGAIALELYVYQAPLTCQNFINLVNDGFYDGMIFQRIMDDFMIQAENTMPDGSTKTSPYGQISKFEGIVS